MGVRLRQLLPFIVLVLLILVVYLSNVHHAFTLENLRLEEIRIKEFVKTHEVLAPLLYIGVYIISVCLVIPDSILLTLLGGLIFPLPLAITYAACAETIGATLFFAIFHTAFGKKFIEKERPFLKKMRKDFRENSSSYLLFLRLSHISPFWLTNIAAAYFKIRFRTFIWTTLVGVLPLTFFLADAGHSLGIFFKKGEAVSLHQLFTPEMKIALVILGVTALVPVLYKKLRKRKKKWFR